jgi:hypothetical protein
LNKKQNYTVADELDRWYTKPEVVDECLAMLEENLIPLKKFGAIVEPSCGMGAFSSKLPASITFDIDPNSVAKYKCDYLLAPIDASPWPRPILVVGNPPFGQRSKLAIDFLNKSLYADFVAFVLPSSILKDSNLKKLNARLIPEFVRELPLGAFECVGDRDWSRSPRCSFVIFRVGHKYDPTDRRELPKKYECPLFSWTNDWNAADFVFKRNGGGCGTARVKTSPDTQTLGGYYYVKSAMGTPPDLLFGLFNESPFPTSNLSVSSKSISQNEATKEIARRFLEHGFTRAAKLINPIFLTPLTDSSGSL